MNSIITAACSLGLMCVSTDGFIERLDSVLTEFRTVAAADIASGTIESVANDANTFVLRSDQESSMTVTVTQTTSYTLNGNESTRDAALAAGRRATVMHENGVASSVDVVTEG